MGSRDTDSLGVGDKGIVGITLIAVMGVTGSGKSNFVRLITGADDSEVGHDLASRKIRDIQLVIVPAI
jgi:ABC-type proline/glycine betaine transport system ATPase subunit